MLPRSIAQDWQFPLVTGESREGWIPELFVVNDFVLAKVNDRSWLLKDLSSDCVHTFQVMGGSVEAAVDVHSEHEVYLALVVDEVDILDEYLLVIYLLSTSSNGQASKIGVVGYVALPSPEDGYAGGTNFWRDSCIECLTVQAPWVALSLGNRLYLYNWRSHVKYCTGINMSHSMPVSGPSIYIFPLCVYTIVCANTYHSSSIRADWIWRQSFICYIGILLRHPYWYRDTPWT